jgi:membrane protein DedA with SNARE-associated domain
VQHFVETYGYVAVFLLIAGESLGIPLPGEITLLAAAVYAGSGHMRIEWVIVTAAVGTFVGSVAGYAIGRSAGRAVLLHYGRYIGIKETHLKRAERFFAQHGDKTILLARFIAVLRTFGSLLAGINNMNLPRFLIFTALGGVIWSVLYGVLAYKLGQTVFESVTRVVGIGGLVVVVLAGVAILIYRRRAARIAHRM